MSFTENNDSIESSNLNTEKYNQMVSNGEHNINTDSKDDSLLKYIENLKITQQSKSQEIFSVFDSGMHSAFLGFHLSNPLPTPLTPYHQILLTFIYFAVSGLDILGIELEQDKKKEIIDWIYSVQVESEEDDKNKLFPGGFRGSELMPKKIGNLAITYTALCCLRILGDDFSRLNKNGIIGLLADAYHENGSFQDIGRTFGTSETDVRFVYSACVICTLIQDFNIPGIDWNNVVSFIIQCKSYDGGFGQNPQTESHGGSTYCAVSALFLLNRLDAIENKQDLELWLLKRQITGFQGRINKPPDSCYSFWVGGTLRNLGLNHLVDGNMCARFILECENKKKGGFCKDPTSNSDILHTYMSISGLSIFGHPKLREINSAIGLTKRAAEGLKLPELPENLAKLL